jgi:WD40 repeat protein
MTAAPLPGLHDVFISYSRKDTPFAAALERALKRYRPPKDLPVPRRRLDVFRDEEDFTGTEYHTAVERHISGSHKLILVCSPNAYRSEFVNDETRRFLRSHEPSEIIPLLFAGLPNNEAKPGEESRMAFPPALCERVEVPLAADYRGFNPTSDRVDSRRFRSAWYKLIADIYGRTRAEVEAREQRRRVRQRVVWGGTSAAVAVAVGGALTVAAMQRARADVEARTSRSNELAGSAMSLVDRDPELATLLAIEAADQSPSAGATSALRAALARLPDWQRSATAPNSMDAVVAVAYAPDARWVAIADGPKVHVLDAATGRARFEVIGTMPVRHIRYSPNGALLAVVGDSGRTTIYAAATGARVASVAGDLHWQQPTAGGGVPAVLLRERDVQVIELDATGHVRVVRELRPPGYALDPYGTGQTTLSPDAGRLASLDKGVDERAARMTVTDLRTAATVSRVVSTTATSGLVWSPGGARIAAHNLFGFSVFDSRSLRPGFTHDGDETSVEDVSFSPNETQLAITDRGGATSLWDLRGKTRVAELSGEETRAYGPVFSPDGTLLTVRYANGRGDLWNLENRRRIAVFDGTWGEVWSTDISPDGTALIVQYEQGRIAFWRVDRWRRERRLPPDYTRPALAGGARNHLGARVLRLEGHEAALVDSATGRRILRFPHADDVSSAEFSPSGRCVVTASGYRMASGGAPNDGNLVRLWDAATATMLVEWRLGDFGADSAFFADDERVIVMARDVGDVYHTRLCTPLEVLLPLARQRVGRALTAAERARYVSP